MQENTFYSIYTYNMLIVLEQHMLVIGEKRRKELNIWPSNLLRPGNEGENM